MFKKISIFVDAHLRKLAKQDEKLAKALGYALAFPGDLVRLYFLGYHQKENLPAYLQDMYKFFDGCHYEHIAPRMPLNRRIALRQLLRRSVAMWLK